MDLALLTRRLRFSEFLLWISTVKPSITRRSPPSPEFMPYIQLLYPVIQSSADIQRLCGLSLAAPPIKTARIIFSYTHCDNPRSLSVYLRPNPSSVGLRYGSHGAVRKMLRMKGGIIAYDNRPLYTVFQLAYITGHEYFLICLERYC
jgi:hypothetical protein